MSTAGTVPRQGTTAEALTDARQEQLAHDKVRRGPKGRNGNGTPGKRVKSAWRAFNAAQGAPKNMLSLKEFARRADASRTAGSGWPDAMAPLQANVREWLASKGAGTPEQREARRLRLRERRSVNLASKMARRGKGKQQQAPKKETSRTMRQ